MPEQNSPRPQGASTSSPGVSQGAADQSDPNCTPGDGAGPVREAGGTTGAGNLSPGQASRTGGATGGVATGAQQPSRPGTIPPDA